MNCKMRKTKKNSGGSRWSIATSRRDNKNCYLDSVTPYDSSSPNPPLFGTIVNEPGNKQCSDFYMGENIPGSDNLIRVDDCNNILYKTGTGLNTQFHFCRKGPNKTGICGTESPNRKMIGNCNNNTSLLIEDRKIQKGTNDHQKAMHYEARRITSSLPSVPVQPEFPSVPTTTRRTGGRIVKKSKRSKKSRRPKLSKRSKKSRKPKLSKRSKKSRKSK